MKKSIIIFFLLVKSFSYSEDNSNTGIMTYLNVENYFLLPEEINNNYNLIIKYSDNFVYLFKRIQRAIKKSEKLSIYKINKDITSLLTFTLPYNDEWIHDFCLANKHLYILTTNQIVIYYIGNDNLIYEKDIKLGINRYDEIKIENNIITLLRSCYSCDFCGIRTFVCDTNGNQISNHDFKVPKGFQLDYYAPNKRFDYCNNKYIVSDILDYNILIYNNKYEKIAHLQRSLKLFEENKNIEHIFDTNSYNVWVNQSKYNDSMRFFSRLEFAEFCDDSTIFVSYIDGKKFKNSNDGRYYDIWKFDKKNNKWELNKKDLINKFPSKENQREFLTLEYISGGLLNTYKISNGKILCIKRIGIDLSKIEFNKTILKDYWEMNTNYYENNNLRFTLFVYSIK
jgi:hypothetical protein